MKKFITLTCIVFYAIASNAQSTGDYKSSKTGNWTDITVWQRYNGTKWVSASAYPTSSDGVITISDLTTVTVNANITIDQTVVVAGGALSLVSNYTISLNNTPGDDLIVNGRMNWFSGNIDGAGSMAINGTCDWTGGNLKVTLNNNGIVTIGYVYLYATSVFNNNGTVNWFYNSDIRFYGGKFNNNNIFNAYGTGTLYNYSSGGIFNNTKTGIFNVQNTDYMTNNITFNNKGKMNFMAGSFYNYSGTFTNNKIMNFSGGGFMNRGTASIENGTKITGEGYIRLVNYSLNFNIAVSLPAGITLDIEGASNITGSGSLTVSGILNWNYGSISVPLTLESSSVAYIYNYSGYLYNKLTNNGIINWNGYDLKMYDGSIINNKTFNVNCNNTISQYNTSHPGSFINNATGTVNKTYIGGSTVSVAFQNKGTITGMGDFIFGANLTNTGTFDPGFGDSTAILTTGTNYTNKQLTLKIKGAEPGISFDRLVVNGTATLSGSTLNVTASGNIPAGAYVIVSCSGRTGTFSTTHLPAGYTLTYKSDQVILNVPDDFASQTDNTAENATKQTLENKALTVAPNPATQNINISFQSKNKSATLRIFDENGKPVLESTVVSAASNNVNVSRLIAGTYIIQVTDGATTQSAKFIKQ